MTPRDLVYVGHMLDTARKAVGKTEGISRETYDADENLRLALIHLIQTIGEAARQSRESSAASTRTSAGATSSGCVTVKETCGTQDSDGAMTMPLTHETTALAVATALS